MTKNRKSLTGEVVHMYEPMRREDAIVPKLVAKNMRLRTIVRFGYDVDEQMTVRTLH